jgi:uncharacterized protein YjiS (DUF1127 family)
MVMKGFEFITQTRVETAMPVALPATRRHRHPALSILALLHHSLDLKRSRGRLALLDDHLLRDIGLTREAAESEAERPLWDVPTHWRG